MARFYESTPAILSASSESYFIEQPFRSYELLDSGKGKRYLCSVTKTIDVMKLKLLFISLPIALTLGTGVWTTIRLIEPVSAEEMSAVLSETSGMSSSEALQAFEQAGISETLLAKILDCSRFTLQRLRDSESSPTPSLDATILGLYSNYLLLKKSNLLFRCRFHSGYDQFYCFPNPLQEEES